MEADFSEFIKKTTIKALFSDDDLMDVLVLKGGNAIDIIHKVSERASADIDLSIADEFQDRVGTREKLLKVLQTTFAESGYSVFDTKFEEVPASISPDMTDFWGGYKLEFKIAKHEIFRQYNMDIDTLRRQAEVVSTNQGKRILVEISKHEYCVPKQQREIDGLTVYVYPPNVIVIEKLRAICQQMPEYRDMVKSQSASARAKDFYDIHLLTGVYSIDLTEDENKRLIEIIFAAKRVPLKLLSKVREYRDYHSQDFGSVVATVRRKDELKEFDYYFDYVVNICKNLESLWKK